MDRRERLARALRAEPVDRVPVWLMRQAGRHLPGYRALRARYGILDIARNPELAVQVTFEPLERFDLDSAVIFADITIPFLGLGVDFRIDPGVGPVLSQPLRTPKDVDGLHPFVADRDAGFVGEAIRLFRERHPGWPIVGFAGAPFTLACYLVEGGPSREFLQTRRLMHSDPGLFGRLLDLLTEATVDYLKMQGRAGVDAIQLFDTWVGNLSRTAFEAAILPRLQRMFAELAGLQIPRIYFSTGSAHLVPLTGRSGADAVGTDWRLSLADVRQQLGRAIAVQGNLDPAALLTDPPTVRRMARAILDEIPDGLGHVFNLGHGVPPGASADCVDALVEYVHAYSSARVRS